MCLCVFMCACVCMSMCVVCVNVCIWVRANVCVSVCVCIQCAHVEVRGQLCGGGSVLPPFYGSGNWILLELSPAETPSWPSSHTSVYSSTSLIRLPYSNSRGGCVQEHEQFTSSVPLSKCPSLPNCQGILRMRGCSTGPPSSCWLPINLGVRVLWAHPMMECPWDQSWAVLGS